MDAAQSRDTRASDADRETVSRWLASAAGEGRITTEEMEDRLAGARQARTYGELEELVRDLPSREEPGPSTAPETLRVSASLRNARMRGTWRVPPRVVASAGRGFVLLDFTEALVEQGEVTVDARPNWRSITLVVPDSYTVTTQESVPGTGDIQDRTNPGPAPEPGKSGESGEPEESEKPEEPGERAPRIHVLARPGLGSVIIRGPRRRWRPRPRRQDSEARR